MAVAGESYQPTRLKSFKSTNDLSTKQFYAVALDASNADSIVLANDQTLPTIGLLVKPPSVAGDDCQVALFGPTCLAIVGGAVTKGAALQADAAGKLIATTTAADLVVAVALETAPNGDGDRIEVMMTGGHYYHA